ncbi:MAG TPA: zf-HC2 domain-containing protein [Candidatus Limnocylindria bacterium]|nr:zf-HC2 domain-containing protein [Candidatus Limnocylindria bacterium]
MTLQHPHAELSAYLDGALAPAAQAAVEGHLAACALCRAHLAQLRATTAFLRALPDPVPARQLVPRLAPPVWLAPLRTLMTLASGTAVFLFIASSLMTNITFLAGGGPTGMSAQEASRDAVTALQAPTAAQPTPSAAGPAPAGTAEAAALDAAKRQDASASPPAAPGAAGSQDTAQLGSSEPRPSPLLNPWLWLTLAVISGATAIALQRRLRAPV